MLSERSRYFQGLSFTLPDSLYVTSLVKEYLPEETGKSSGDVPERYLERGAKVMRAELDVLAEHGALPHLILIFGGCVWPHACRAFQGEGPVKRTAYEHFTVTEYEWTNGSSRHFVNRIAVRVNGREEHTLLARCHHPAAWERNVTPKELLRRDDFRRLAGIAGNGAGANASN